MSFDPNDGAPVIPSDLQQYNSYVVDPIYQSRFTIAWTSVLAAAVVISLPRLFQGLRSRRLLTGLGGAREGWRTTPSKGNTGPSGRTPSSLRPLAILLGALQYTPPFARLALGEILLVCALAAAVVACVVREAPLLENPNRAGFMALALLPPSFLFAQKTPLTTLLMSESSYAKLNFLHRFSSRLMVLCGLIHGSMWISNHVIWNLPIIGQQKEASGVATLGFLCVLGLSSVRIIRRQAYNFFWTLHVLSFPAFFILVCYHTIYAPPWIYPPIALYTLDLLYRFLRFRLTEARMVALDNQMTLIHLPRVNHSWRAGQFFNVRLFTDGLGVFETHSLTTASAPAGVGTFDLPLRAFGTLSAEVKELLEIPSDDELKKKDQEEPPSPGEKWLHSTIHINQGGMLFGARACGNWTRNLNKWVAKEAKVSAPVTLENVSKQVHTLASLDGPYGGLAPSFDLGNYDNVLLYAGGSGITFSLGVLDELIGRAVRTSGDGLGGAGLVPVNTQRIELVWCIRSFGSIKWFSAHMMRLALAAAAVTSRTLELHIIIYVTCLCDPEAVPLIPNLDVRVGNERPDVNMEMRRFMGIGPAQSTPPSESVDGSSEELPTKHEIKKAGGSLAVAASGPEGLVTEVQNLVSSLRMRNTLSSPVGYHGEVYAI